ncbi:ShlB/FhaC/HecB family hemolysin secretion/activation protein [Sphingomonas sp. PB4P5]|uniref:ShlB/FhaC/HecB family hemolysin secretion/activation protein n=1 Tax=Parasphingomonas puruogangriensis TaxID=3096155 RepID=UPI002FC6FE80
MAKTALKKMLRGSSVTLFAISPAAVLAQQQPVPPPQPMVPQGALPSRQEVTPPTPDTRQSGAVSVDASKAVDLAPCPFDGSPLKLTISKLNFTRPDGSAVEPKIAATLARVTPPVGERPLSEVCAIRDRANAALRSAGWVASVKIPPQEIAGGTLELQVVTAKIVEIRVRGSAGAYEGILHRRIAQIQALDPLNEHEAERLLLLAGDIPGLEVQLSLRPAGTEQGEVIGELTVASRRYAILGNVQNQNSRLTGRETAYLRGEFYGLTGQADVTYVGLSSTVDFQEQIVAQVGHIMGIDNSGTTVGARFTYAWSRPDLGALDFRTNTLIAGFDIARPLIRSLRTNLRASGGVDYVDQRSVIKSGDLSIPLTQDKLRIAFLGLDADHRTLRLDGKTALSLGGSLQVRKGFDILDASKQGYRGGTLTSRINGNASALVVRGALDGMIALGPIFSIAGQAQGQWANDPLLNYEQYSVGNLTIGRGYDPGVSTGDQAAAGRGELRVDVPVSTRIGTQLFGFYDYVYLRNLDSSAIERSRTFRSFGGGLRVSLPGLAVLDVTYARPRDKASRLDDRRPPNRLLVSLTAQIFDRSR